MHVHWVLMGNGFFEVRSPPPRREMRVVLQHVLPVCVFFPSCRPLHAAPTFGRFFSLPPSVPSPLPRPIASLHRRKPLLAHPPPPATAAPARRPRDRQEPLALAAPLPTISLCHHDAASEARPRDVGSPDRCAAAIAERSAARGVWVGVWAASAPAAVTGPRARPFALAGPRSGSAAHSPGSSGPGVFVEMRTSFRSA